MEKEKAMFMENMGKKVLQSHDQPRTTGTRQRKSKAEFLERTTILTGMIQRSMKETIERCGMMTLRSNTPKITTLY